MIKDNTMTTLRDLTTERLALQHKLESSGINDEAINDTLEGDSVAIAAKIEDYCYVIANMEAPISIINDEIERLTARRESYEKRVISIKNWLFVNMVACNYTKIVCPMFTASIQNNPPSVVVYDLAAIPSEFMRAKPAPAPEPDKNAIKEALKAGIAVEGAHLESSQKLVIK